MRSLATLTTCFFPIVNFVIIKPVLLGQCSLCLWNVIHFQRNSHDLNWNIGTFYHVLQFFWCIGTLFTNLKNIICQYLLSANLEAWQLFLYSNKHHSGVHPFETSAHVAQANFWMRCLDCVPPIIHFERFSMELINDDNPLYSQIHKLFNNEKYIQHTWLGAT